MSRLKSLYIFEGYRLWLREASEKSNVYIVWYSRVSGSRDNSQPSKSHLFVIIVLRCNIINHQMMLTLLYNFVEFSRWCYTYLLIFHLFVYKLWSATAHRELSSRDWLFGRGSSWRRILSKIVCEVAATGCRGNCEGVFLGSRGALRASRDRSLWEPVQIISCIGGKSVEMCSTNVLIEMTLSHNPLESPFVIHNTPTHAHTMSLKRFTATLNSQNFYAACTS